MANSGFGNSLGGPRVPFQQWGDTAIWFSMALSMPVRLPLERGIGLGWLGYVFLGITALFYLVASWWGNLHIGFSLFAGVQMQSGGDSSLLYYVFFVYLPWGIYEHVQRIREERQGREPHSYDFGTTRLGDYLPFSEKVLHIGVGPLTALLCGAVIHRFGGRLLGFWLMVSALALCVTEIKRFTLLKKEYRESRDNQKRAQWQGEMMSQAVKRSEERGGKGESIPTGSDDSLTAEIERRKRDMMANRGANGNDGEVIQ